MMIEIDGAHHLRATPRYKLFQPTEITVEKRVARAHILNLSAGGVLVSVSEPPAQDTVLEVQCGGKTLRARVIWTKDDRLGAAFLWPLTDTYVSALVAAQDAALALKTARRLLRSPAE
ncbi:PilZ domain-containing protein [Sphingomonas panacisoli]|uniref:PilZ domain-containing protein n=1 Tax=Sphingomonas panacisoli TaxID=1813879 RepID=A0A5B8LI81_9SPHN|nr:PilZ domain-containing protein [Sphingomonas panacisoli]QDZ06860.1 PilZ domain-containing protein [Sphingomonas panacisoli]